MIAIIKRDGAADATAVKRLLHGAMTFEAGIHKVAGVFNEVRPVPLTLLTAEVEHAYTRFGKQ